MAQEEGPWLTLTLRETGPEGVEAPKLARFLEALSSAMYVIARSKLGGDALRPGPRTLAEDALAAVRVVRVEPGSAIIQLAPPPEAAQGRLTLAAEATPDDVALELLDEVQRLNSGEPAIEGRWEIRRRVREVVVDAGQIGSQAEIALRPLFPRPGLPAGSVRRASFRTREISTEAEPPRERRSRRVSGHAFMVDVEPGKQRLRIKLPDGRDMTLDVDEGIVPAIHDALDRVVDLEIEEELEGTTAVSKVARSVAILPPAGATTDRPAKSIADLEREQNMPAERPDYAALSSAIWESQEQITAFAEHIRNVRQAETLQT